MPGPEDVKTQDNLLECTCGKKGTCSYCKSRAHKAEVYRKFYRAHRGLHLIYDFGRADDRVIKTVSDALDIAAAHKQLVAMGQQIGITHEPDQFSLLDALSSEHAPGAPASPFARELMRKAVARVQPESRYTLAPLYIPGLLDAHKEWTDADSLQKAVWGLSTSGMTDVYLQHHPKIVAGKRVEIVSWPYAVEASLHVPGEVRKDKQRVVLPAGTIYQGTVWAPWAWGLVKKGKLRGLSMGGVAKRRAGMAPIVEADFGAEGEALADNVEVATRKAVDEAPTWFKKHGSHNQKSHGKRDGGSTDPSDEDYVEPDEVEEYYQARGKKRVDGLGNPRRWETGAENHTRRLRQWFKRRKKKGTTAHDASMRAAATTPFG